MICERVHELLPALADAELGYVRRVLVERHIRDCADCAARLDALRAMRATLRLRLPVHRAPPGLAARIGAALPREMAPPPARPWFPRLVVAGSGLTGAVAGMALTLLVLHGQRPDEALSGELISSHIRSLMADHLTDVATSDQHTVKPWLSARLDVSPPARDLAAAGFPLIGGRLDYIDGHKGAAVVYRRAQHVINLFAWAVPGNDTSFAEQSSRGFNIVSWRHEGIAYHAVSDVNMDELAAFARLVRSGS